MDEKKYSSPSITMLWTNEQDVLTASTEYGVNWGETWGSGSNNNEQGMFE